ncbi:MAG: cellulase family glycosylhydrolase [Oscillospiraceae bacterium]|nr:cellulase family glycosylhydrolase [Oscillospiraceae bacterium]
MGMMKKLVSALTAGVMAVSMAASMTSVSAADKTAMEIVNDMGQGWNLGNTFDCWNTRGWTTDTETGWGNPRTTKDMITAIHASGFDSIRIPVTWYENTNAQTYDIDDAYLARVKEVIDYAYDQGMYVIINMHWDWVTDTSKNLWLNKGLDAVPQFNTMWTEIANYFKDYDQHLVFEDMNEVAWQDNPYAGYNENSYKTLNTLNAEFVKTVRKTGGKNANRLLLLAGANTDLDNTCNAQFVVPDDKMVAVSIHYYRPSPFCVAEQGADWGYAATWGTDADLAAVKADFAKMKTTFMDKGVPVILGEYGVVTSAKGAKDKPSMYKFLKTVAETTKATDGITCYLWDASNAGDMVYFNRKTLQWFDPEIQKIYADLKGSSGTDTPSFEVKNRVTIPMSEIPKDDTGYRLDLTKYGEMGLKLTGALMQGKITSGESVGYGFGFEAVRNGSGAAVWTGEPAILGADGILNVEFDGKGQDDDGTAYTYDINMRYLQIQEWWTTPQNGATAELESLTLIFDKDVPGSGDTKPTTQPTTKPTETTTQTTTETTQTTTETTQTSTETTQTTTETTQVSTETTQTSTETTQTSTETTQTSTEVTQPVGDVMTGDLNGDKKIDIMDVIAINKFLLGAKDFDAATRAAADADGNGEIDSNDSLQILKLALK